MTSEVMYQNQGQLLAMLQLAKQQQEVSELHYPHLLPAIEKPTHQDSHEPSSSETEEVTTAKGHRK
jgi:hypothetical protein